MIQNIGLAILRISAGLMLAFGHGVGKLPPSDHFVDIVASLGFPIPLVFAWAATASEFLGGLLLAAGLFTRPAALSILITMTVAAFLRQANDPFPAKEKAILYGLVALAFLLFGAGKFGVDALLKKKRTS